MPGSIASPSFHFSSRTLHADDVALRDVAEAVGTPTYVYSARAIRRAFGRLQEAFRPLAVRFHYALKASPNLHLCALMRELGAGMDVVSGGELERAWQAGSEMRDIVFAGVGKSDAEIRAALDGRHSLVADRSRAGLRPPDGRGPVGTLNAESVSEIERIAHWGRVLGVRPRVCVRVNPDVDPLTHEYTTTGKEENKFGIDAPLIPAVFDRWAGDEDLELVGLHIHLGSPVPQVEPYAEAVAVLLRLVDEIAAGGHRVEVLDLGGGWPVEYQEGEVPPVEAYADRLIPLLEPRVADGLQVLMEPGRSIMANSGVLLTRVQHVKRGRNKTFVICDAGMQTLIRPALYRAFHFIWPVDWAEMPPRLVEDPGLDGLERCDVVGPICETGDFLARHRSLPPLDRGDLLAVFSAGAYGRSMSSNYNDHGIPAEVLIDGEQATLIGERQSLEALLSTEARPRLLDLD